MNTNYRCRSITLMTPYYLDHGSLRRSRQQLLLITRQSWCFGCRRRVRGNTTERGSCSKESGSGRGARCVEIRGRNGRSMGCRSRHIVRPRDRGNRPANQFFLRNPREPNVVRRKCSLRSRSDRHRKLYRTCCLVSFRKMRHPASERHHPTRSAVEPDRSILQVMEVTHNCSRPEKLEPLRLRRQSLTTSDSNSKSTSLSLLRLGKLWGPRRT